MCAFRALTSAALNIRRHGASFDRSSPDHVLGRHGLHRPRDDLRQDLLNVRVALADGQIQRGVVALMMSVGSWEK